MKTNLFKQYLSYLRDVKQLSSLLDILRKTNVRSGEIELKEKITHLSVLHILVEKNKNIVLNNISLGADKGERIALIGDLETEKNALANLLIRTYDPNKGEIMINEKYNIKDLTLTSLQQRIAYIAQPIEFKKESIAQNVAYHQTYEKQKVKNALNKTHALEFIEHLEEGIETRLSKKGTNLSKGEQQLIALARAVYKEPDILIYQEPTFPIDSKSETLIQKTLHELKSEMIIISITNQRNSLKNADAILLFKEGKIVCRGQHQILIEECEEYRNFIGN